MSPLTFRKINKENENKMRGRPDQAAAGSYATEEKKKIRKENYLKEKGGAFRD